MTQALLAVVALAAGSLLSPVTSAVLAANGPPRTAPSRLGVGVAAQPDPSGLYGWMPETGIPWDYAYQYLAGGVNTEHGWSTWNPDGRFVTSYAQGAAQHQYQPVFTYYQLLQSNGPCGQCGEAEKDLTHLNDAAAMARYYADFTLLIKRLGPGTQDGVPGFGQAAIVHVEPDLSGYAEQAALDSGSCFGLCTGSGNDPALVRAAVARSGVADVASFPNTYQGFNWALLHLRDLYAPKVLLAIHLSNWALRPDIGSSTDPNLDGAALGRSAGEFAAASGARSVPNGVSPYDLLFNDVADRDAAYYKYVFNNPHAFWDRLNVALPNFQRWEQYLGAAVQTAGRPAMVWQIPLGNQYFQSENNSEGHYQDNRVEYFFGHLDELSKIGVVGLLFGAGNRGSTVASDGQHDGVTNPEPICTSDGLSSGQLCNDHPSLVADDDGGYLRLAAERFYAVAGSARAAWNPAPNILAATPLASQSDTLGVTLGAATVSPDAPSVGDSVTFSPEVTVTRGVTVLADFELYDANGQKAWQEWDPTVTVSAGAVQVVQHTFTVPTTLAPDTYLLKIGFFAPDWQVLYAWNDSAGQLAISGLASLVVPAG